MPKLTKGQADTICIGILEGFGAPPDEAKLVAGLLVKANLMGVDSHGIVRIPEYAVDIEAGTLKVGAPIKVSRESETTALVDGDWNFGQVTAMKATEIAIDKAGRHGISMVGAVNCNHVGRLADYVMLAAEHNLVGIMMVKTSSLVAPYGGTRRILGPNPLGIAIPVRDGRPIFLDMATSASAAGKIMIKRVRGEQLPQGWIVDADGRPSIEPGDLFAGGSLLPFGGYKGYGLSVMVDILGGALTGVGCGSAIGGEYGAFACGVTFVVMKTDCFVSNEQFDESVGQLVEEIRSSPPQAGAEVLMPGDPEYKEQDKRLREGFDVDDETWEKLTHLARRFGVGVER